MIEGILLENALEEILKRADRITDTKKVKVEEANGFCLAENIYAELDNPPFPRSPVDGYAVRSEDIRGAVRGNPAVLKVAGCIYAGDNGGAFSIKPGEAYRIMTGAPFPEGADTAVKQEDTDCGEETVKVNKSQKPWDNYCFQGEDYKKNSLLLAKGSRITFAEQGILSGIGRTEVAVYRKPVIRVLTTGDELCQPGNPLKPGKIYDSNGMMVSSRLRELGVKPESVSHCADSEAGLAAELKKAAEDADIIVTTGGVSVGKKDILTRSPGNPWSRKNILEDPASARDPYYFFRIRENSDPFPVRKSLWCHGKSGTAFASCAGSHDRRSCLCYGNEKRDYGSGL